jgi:hypothetical protein
MASGTDKHRSSSIATIQTGRGCYQMRSRSPITSTENYALKLNAGHVLHPSEQNDSYYVLLAL